MCQQFNITHCIAKTFSLICFLQLQQHTAIISIKNTIFLLWKLSYIITITSPVVVPSKIWRPEWIDVRVSQSNMCIHIKWSFIYTPFHTFHGVTGTTTATPSSLCLQNFKFQHSSIRPINFQTTSNTKTRGNYCESSECSNYIPVASLTA